MARIPDAFIDDLLARTDIVEVIGTRVPLKRQGREYSARCPVPRRTLAVVHRVADQAVLPLLRLRRARHRDHVPDELRPPGVPRRGRGAGQARRHGGAARDAQAATRTSESRDALRRARGRGEILPAASWRSSAKARAYLERRGVDADNRARFGIGYAPEGFDALKDALGTDERRLRAARQGRHAVEERQRPRLRQVPRPRDVPDPRPPRPRDRLRRPRAGARTTARNTSTRPRPRCSTRAASCTACGRCGRRNAKIARLVVVEGYMDVVALFQYGVTQAVATLGTATTPDHAELLFRNAADVYFCFDGDRAGRGAGVEGGGIGAAAHARRPPGLLPVPARRRGSGHASCAAKARPASTRACAQATPLSRILLRRTVART